MIRAQKNKLSKCGVWFYTLFILVIFSLSACNKDFEDKHEFTNTTDTVLEARSSKVLYIILDGARGKSIETSLAPNLTKIKANANYAYQSVSDESGLDATTWTDMLTGVNKAKHKVTDANFTSNQLANYPMFFKRIKEKTTLRTAAFCASQRLSQNLVTNADANLAFNDDDLAVKNATIDELKRDDAAIVLAEFNSIGKAGAQYGYDNSVAQYKNAILNVDTYIGELVAQLKNRKNHGNENWLVIVASNQGGTYTVDPADNDGTLYSQPLLNSYVLFYSPNFKTYIYEKPPTVSLPYQGSLVKLTGTTARATLSAENASIFNFGTGVSAPEYTIEFKLKVTAFGTVNAEILSKNPNPYGGSSSYSGWFVIQNGSSRKWRLGGFGSYTIATSDDTKVPVLVENNWYTLGFKIYNESGKRWVKLFQDGVVASNPVDITSKNGTNVDAALIAGFINGGTGTTAQQYITDLRLFKAAIPDNIIKNYSCQVNVPATHPYYSSLIGYWPATDGSGTAFADKVSGVRNFSIGSATPTWETFSDSDPKFCIPLPTDLYERTPRGVDIPKYIFTWLKIKTDSYNLDGKTWIPFYTITQ